jgi:hypothetical protein
MPKKGFCQAGKLHLKQHRTFWISISLKKDGFDEKNSY